MDEKVKDIRERLDTIKLSQCGWEDREDIMTFNGKPIGMTISRNIEIGRWWPALKNELVTVIITLLSDKEKEIDELNDKVKELIEGIEKALRWMHNDIEYKNKEVRTALYSLIKKG